MAYGNGGNVNQAMQAQSALGNYKDAGETNRMPGAVSMHTLEVHQGLAELARRVDALENALTPILTPEPPQTNASGGGTPPAPMRSSVADSLANAGSLVGHLIGRLERLTNRVEL
jgi:hypothetical protein